MRRRRRKNPFWAPAERSEKFTLVTDGQRYGAIHPGHLLPAAYEGWRVVQKGLPSLEACQRAAEEDERAWESLNEKRNPRRRNPAPKTEKQAYELGYSTGDDPTGMVGFNSSWPSSDDFIRPNKLVRAYMRGHSDGQSAQMNWKETIQDRDNPRRRRNPIPRSAPSRAILCVGQLRQLEIFDPKTGRTGTIKPQNKWLAWDGKQFQICNVQGQVNASLPSKLVARHRKFHNANPQGKPFLGSMPDRGPTVKNVGLLKSLVYYVPSKIRSPGKNKYLWHHAFGDTGHKGGDSYPTKVMPMLQRDSAGNLFIKRRPGNIFRVDNWLRG